jgi:hypothetical protein
MNTGSTIQSLRETKPNLFNHLVEHPSIRVVECYLHLASLEFHTLWHVAEKLKNAGFTEEEISESMKIYMKF